MTGWSAPADLDSHSARIWYQHWWTDQPAVDAETSAI